MRSSHVSILFDDLNEIIQKRIRILIRLANVELITIFWEIGFILNKHVDEIKRVKELTQTIQDISIKLTENYGQFLMEENLRNCMLFARRFPDLSEIRELSLYLGWEHFLQLSKIEDLKERQFYIKLKIKNGLSSQDLQNAISARCYDEEILNKSNHVRSPHLKNRRRNNNNETYKTVTHDFKKIMVNDKVICVVFDEPLLSSFRALTQPQRKHLFTKSKRSNNSEPKIFVELYNIIENYSRIQNQSLNAHLNFLFWEVGMRMNEEINICKVSGGDIRKSLISQASKILKKQYNGFFEEEQLDAMMNFAKQISNIGSASWLTAIVSWEHIVLLSSLNEVNTIFFYAKLIATKGLDVRELRKEIDKKTYEQIPEFEKVDQELLCKINYPIKSVKVERNRQTVTSISTIDYQFEEIKRNSFVMNVFKSPSFNKFTKANLNHNYANNNSR